MFYKLSLNSGSNRTTYKEFFECLGTGLCNVWWFAFLSFRPSLFWGAVIFSFLICFWWLLVCQMYQEEGFKFCLDTRNNGALPLDWACPEHLSLWSPAGLPYRLDPMRGQKVEKLGQRMKMELRGKSFKNLDNT